MLKKHQAVQPDLTPGQVAHGQALLFSLDKQNSAHRDQHTFCSHAHNKQTISQHLAWNKYTHFIPKKLPGKWQMLLLFSDLSGTGHRQATTHLQKWAPCPIPEYFGLK